MPPFGRLSKPAINPDEFPSLGDAATKGEAAKRPPQEREQQVSERWQQRRFASLMHCFYDAAARQVMHPAPTLMMA